MTDFRSRTPNIATLARALDVDYSHLHAVLKGRKDPSVPLARRIEAETGGAIRWTEFFESALPTPTEDEGSAA